MTHVRMSFDSYDRFTELFNRMEYRADEYTPTIDELEGPITRHFPKYALFLMWIDETGVVTPENAWPRRIIRGLLTEGLELFSEEPAPNRKEPVISGAPDRISPETGRILPSVKVDVREEAS